MPAVEVLQQLRTAAADFPTDPYLLSVTATREPHCGTVTVRWEDNTVLVAPPSSWPASEADGNRQISLLWPPAEPGGYSLIVDGTATSTQRDGAPALSITVTKAVLHRRGPAPEGNDSSCGSDCVPIFKR